MMHRLLSVVAAAGVLLCAGCTSDSSSAGSGASGQPTIAPATTAAPTDPPTGGQPEHTGELTAAATAVPTWGTADEEATRLLALDALRAYARPDVAAEPWFEELAGYLTANGQAAYYGTDPATVPIRDVVDATVTSPSPYLARAVARTDGGDWQVLMVREDAASPWRVEWLRPLP